MPEPLLPPGYRLGKALYSGAAFSVVRALREDIETEVLLRLVSNGSDEAEVHAEVQGRLLSEFLDGAPRDPAGFLDLAVPLVRWLAEYHQEGLCHHAVHPHGLIVTGTSGDYSVSSFDPGERAGPPSAGDGAGTLAHWTEELVEYASPERTGRTSIPVDLRSDLYSLGIILFEILCGRVPFQAQDPVELIHAHLARPPEIPAELKSQIPEALARIVLRLLEKSPERRYPTGQVLMADLEALRDIWDMTGTIPEPGADVAEGASDFHLSDRVFGRSKEIGQLTEMLLRVTAGATELALVEGQPGIGASQLVEELREPVLRIGGSFVKGKFDQAGPEAPYAAVVGAFRELVRHSLGQPVGLLQTRRDRLLGQLGGNARVLVEEIPELAHVVGTFPPLPEIPPIEAQQRFRFAFRVFVGVFSGPENPLVVVLEDLHWADSASLDLIQDLASGSRGHLLFVGTLRKGSLEDDHPLHGVLSRLEGAGIDVSRIEPLPLGAEVVTEMILDSFPGCANPSELGSFLAQRTDGNPLLIRETLERLHHDGLLRYDVAVGGWRWDVDEVRAHSISDNVAELMAQRLERLTPETRRLLSYAAWLGNAFDTRTLSIATGIDSPELADPLAEAVGMGIVAPSLSSLDQGTYQFLHDRVQTVAGDLVPEDQRVDRHEAIGKAMLRGWSKEELEDRAFHALRHLGRAVDRLDAQEAIQVAQLGLLAAGKAAASMDHATAARLLKQGIEAIPDRAVEGRGLLREIHSQLGLSLSFTGRFDEGSHHLRTAIANCESDLERARVHRSQVVCATLKGDEGEALLAGIDGLAELGVHLALDPGPARVALELLVSRIRLRGRKPKDLLALPELEGEAPRVALEILTDLSTVAYSRSAPQAGLVFLKMTNLILRYGKLDLASYVFAIYGQVITSAMGRYEEAFELGQAALELSNHYGEPVLRGRTLYTCGVLLNHWRNDAREDVDLFRRARRLLLDNGDLLWVAFTDPQLNMCGVFLGDTLDDVVSQGDEGLAFAVASHYRNLLPYHTATKLWALDLAGKTVSPGVWSGGGHTEEELELQIGESDFTPGIAFARILRMYGLAILGDHSQALQARDRLLPDHTTAGQLFEAESLFAEGIALMGVLRGGGEDRRTRTRRLGRIHKKFKKWSGLCPANFEGRRLILEAGLRWEDRERAAALLGEAAETAEENGYPHLGGIAQELLARVHLGSGDAPAGHRSLERAVHCYRSWGAHGKLKKMREEFPWLLPEDVSGIPDQDVNVPIGQGSGDPTDLVSLLKVTQSFSGETRLDSLLERVLGACVENAGASGGALVIEGEDGLVVEGRVGPGQQGARIEAVPLEEGDVSSAIVRYVARTGEPIVLDDAVEDPRFASDRHVSSFSRLSVLCCPLLYRGTRSGILYLENHLARGAFGEARLRLVEVLANQAAISLEHARIHRASQDMTQSFARFVPKEMVQILGKRSVVEVHPGEAVARDMTVLFSDLRGFTSLTESKDPSESFRWLNTYLERISPIVGFYGGFIDKFVGDAIMALFPGDPTDALRAAVGMLQELRPLNVGRGGLSDGFRAGIGLHFGSVMLGSVGSSRRLDITAIGDTVNLASRTEEATKVLGASLLVTEPVCQALKEADEFSIRSVGKIRVKGRDAPLEMCEILDGEDPERAESKMVIREMLSEGIGLFQGGSFQRAQEVFSLCRESRPDDAVVRLYLEASKSFLETEPGADWVGELRLPTS